MGLAYIAGASKAAGYDRVRIVDANMSRNPISEISRALAAGPPDIVVLGSTTPVFEASLEISRMLKRLIPETKIIFGGVHSTLFPRDVAGLESVDYLVFGEGERTTGESRQVGTPHSFSV